MIRFLSIVGCLFCSAALYGMSPDEAFNKLMEGNRRFQKRKAVSRNQNQSRRMDLVNVQEPFAVVVACSDSRVAPEILFDCGVGELFVVRVAGNVVGVLEMESIEYAAKYLGSSCILIMGHQNCGAVNAVVQGQTVDVRFLAQLIKSSVVKAKAQDPKNVLKLATEINAETMSEHVKKSPIISGLIQKKQVDVRAAYYDFDTGKVEILGPTVNP